MSISNPSLPTVPAGLHVEGLALDAAGLVITARTIAAEAPCPVCGRASARVHGRYWRTFQDLPWQDRAVTWRVRVRRFRCGRCPGRTFAESVPGLVGIKARRTRNEGRVRALKALRAELPFLDRHLVLVDSPHDGLPIWRFDGAPANLERASFGLPAQEPMLRQLEVDPPGWLGLAGEPIRGPIERTLLLGRSVLPGLGQEGELLAAWAAAKLVTKSDRRKAMMRRDMWTRMEFG